MVDRFTNRLHGRCGLWGRGVARGKTGGKEHAVALLQRDLQRTQQMMQGGGARFGAPGFEATEVTLRNSRDQRQLELAEFGVPAQLAQVFASSRRRVHDVFMTSEVIARGRTLSLT